MIRFVLKIYDFLHSRRKLSIGLLVATTGILLLMAFSLSYNENIFDFLPMTENQQKALTVYQDISGGQSVVVMASSREEREEEQSERLAEAIDSLVKIVQSGNGKLHISNVTSEIDYDKVLGITDMVYHAMPVMLSDSDYLRMEHILSTPGAAEDQLRNDIEMIMMPSSGFFTSDVCNDPLGLFTPVMDRLREKQMSLDFELDDGHIFTSGKKYALAMLESNYGAMESGNNVALVDYVDSVANEVMKSFPDVKIGMTGAPVISVGNAKQIKTDSQWAISIAVTLIIFLLNFFFRKKRNIMLISATIMFGLVFALGFMSVLRSDVSLIVLGIGSVILGISANYPLHFVAHTEQGGKIREILKEMIPPLLIGNITTVGAFVSLIPLEAVALRDLGLFAALILVGTILFVLLLLPHLVREQEVPEKQKLPFERLANTSFEGCTWMVAVVAVLTAVFGYYSMDTSFDANIQNINYMTDEQSTLLSDLQSSGGINDTTNIYIVTEADTWDEALSARSRVAPLLTQLKQTGKINGYTDVSQFICTEAEQKQKIEKWNAFWSTHRDTAFRLLAENASRFEFNEEAFDGFKEIINATYTPQPFEYFEPIRSILLQRTFSTSTGRCAVVEAIDAEGKDMNDIETQLNEAVGTAGFTFDLTGMNTSIAQSLADDFNYIGWACSLIVFLFLWFSFRRIELAVISFVPMAISWVWILGIMSLLGIKFNIVNIILATFIFGQGDDYTIFITEGCISEYVHKKPVLASYKNSIILSALIMFIGIGTLILAKHPALRSLAEVTIVGMFSVVLMAYVIPPLLFKWLMRLFPKRFETL